MAGRKGAKRTCKRRVGTAAWIAGAAILLAILIIGIVSLITGYFILLPHLKLTVLGEKEMEIAAFSDYQDEGAAAKYGRHDLTDQVGIDGEVDTTVPGDYTITYTVSYGKKTCTDQRIVHVTDQDAPVIELVGEEKMTISLRSLYEEPGYTAKDQCDGDLTKAVQITEKQTDNVCTITYAVSDQAGNQAVANRTLEIRDVVAPVISLNGQDHVYTAQGSTYQDDGATATDDADGDLTSAIQQSGSVDTSAAGDYTISYTVSDKAGNKAEISRKVTVYREVSGSTNRVYLTFDDGPSSKVTPRILDILKKNNIKATFFILNYSDSDKPVLKRMISEGHTIGIHGYSHDYATIYSSDEAFMQSVNRLHDKLKSDFGYNATVIRFPGGSSNTISCDYSQGIMSRLTKRVEEEGFAYFDWNVSSGDANGNNIAQSEIYSDTTKNLRQDRDNVVLMHDTNYKETTADALQDIIDYARGNGFVFLPITSDTVPCHHGVAN